LAIFFVPERRYTKKISFESQRLKFFNTASFLILFENSIGVLLNKLQEFLSLEKNLAVSGNIRQHLATSGSIRVE